MGNESADQAPQPPAPSGRPPTAWQPFTFGGIAAFSKASTGRALLVATLAGILLTILILRFFYTAWWPVISAAVDQLPAKGAVRDGWLIWPARSPVVLAENSFLALVINPVPTHRVGQSADLQIVIGATQLEASSLLGAVSISHPKRYEFSLARQDLQPLWYAWRPHVLAGASVGSGIVLFVIWIVLACLATPALKLFAMLFGRVTTIPGCFRMGLMALMPGAVLMALGIVLYNQHDFKLAELMLVHAAHMLMGLVYMTGALLALPKPAPPDPINLQRSNETPQLPLDDASPPPRR